MGEKIARVKGKGREDRLFSGVIRGFQAGKRRSLLGKGETVKVSQKKKGGKKSQALKREGKSRNSH